MSLIDKIKQEAQKTGGSKGKFLYFSKGTKVRVRFLTDIDDGEEIIFHDSFKEGINVPCQEANFGKECPYCEEEGLRTRPLYAWSVYDYESKSVKILMQAVNNCTAVPAIMALYETYGTVLDRDLVITKTGEGQSTTFSVVPMDKVKFRNTKAKAFSKKALLKYLNEAYPSELEADDDEDDDDEDETPRTKSKGKSSKVEKSASTKNTKKRTDYDEDEDDDDYDDDVEDGDDDDDIDYDEMSPKELYQLCKSKKIDCLPKKSEKYYIKKLEEFDQAQDDWDDEDEDEDDE